MDGDGTLVLMEQNDLNLMFVEQKSNKYQHCTPEMKLSS